MRWESIAETQCSIARALSVVGERWTLLILRESFRGIARFDDLRERLGIARNVLAARLQALVEQGVMTRVAYREGPQRFEYRLTEKGRDLYPVLLALLRWGDRWLAEGEPPPLTLIHKGCDHAVTPSLTCSHCGEPLDPGNTRARMRAGFVAAPPGA